MLSTIPPAGQFDLAGWAQCKQCGARLRHRDSAGYGHTAVASSQGDHLAREIDNCHRRY